MLTENDNSNSVEMKGKFKLLGFANVTTSYLYYWKKKNHNKDAFKQVRGNLISRGWLVTEELIT